MLEKYNSSSANGQSPAKKITKIYIIALLFIGLLTISSQLLVRYVLENQSADARVINIAGRQRMLSQKLTKIILLINQAENEKEFTKHCTELKKTRDLWSKSHKALQLGDTSLQIPANNNSKKVEEMFGQLEPYFVAMKNAAIIFDTVTFQTPKAQYKPVVIKVIENESNFLRIMNEITFQYDNEAGKKIDQLKIIELVLLLITLLTLALEAIVVFRPAINKIDIYFKDVQQSNMALLQTNDQLNTAQKELKNYIEELRASEEEIRQNLEELSSINDNLVVQGRIIEKQKEIITRANKGMEDSINAAKRIQDGVLTDEANIISHFKEGFIFNRPRDIVSGDFYWFAEYQGKKVMVVGDCTGHGVSGALMTMVGVSLLNEVVNENKIYRPDEILKNLDNKFLKILKPNQRGVISDGMDLSVLLIDNQEISFAAASNRLYLYRNNEISEIKGSASPLGNFSYYTSKNFKTHKLTVLKNDKFYIFSDGFKDQIGDEEGKVYGSKQFKKLLSEIGGLDMLSQKSIIEAEWLKWKGSNRQTDDIMVVGLRIS